jgi:hypothetical protein
MDDNLKIVERRAQRESRPNLRTYGLVRQLGPWNPTIEDLVEVFAPAPRYGNGHYPRDYDIIDPDAVPNGVDPDMLHSPVSVGGGFSIFNNTVVQPPIYDARITAPGQKLLGPPLEDFSPYASILRPISEMVSEGPPKLEKIKKKGDQKPKDVPLTAQDWQDARDVQNQIMSTRMTPWGPLYSPEETIALYEQLTVSEKRLVKEALTKWKNMTAQERYNEWNQQDSLFRKVFTLYTGQQAAKPTIDFLGTVADLVVLGVLLYSKFL